MTNAAKPAEPLDVFFYEAFAEEADRLRAHAEDNGLRAGFSDLTIQEAGDPAPPASVISIRTQSLLPPEWVSGLHGLLSRSTGYDHLKALQTEFGPACPPFGYLPLYCARSVAEQALLLWTALLRRLPRQIDQFSRFDRDHLTGRENEGKTMALFGVGHIGYEIWRIATALGILVRGVDPVRRHADVAYASPEQALAEADLVVCAMNLTPENRGYFDAERLAQTRRRPILVNVARGEFTPTETLESALESGLLSGVGLDVYNEEASLATGLRSGTFARLATDHHALLRLSRRPDVILTPHNAFNTHEAVERKSEQSIRSLLHFRQTEAFLWPLPDE
jgi:D-lactate dehydrogenase